MRAFLYHYFHDDRRFDLNELYGFIPGTSEKRLYIDANGGVEPSNIDYAHLREKVFRKIIGDHNGDSPVIVKSHNARVLHRKKETVPREMTHKAIYVVRNPLDVVDSFADHTNLSLDEAVDVMCAECARLGGAGTSGSLEILMTWSQHVLSWAYGDQQYPTLIVRYEDLLAAPELHFRNVVSFLGWQVFEDQLEQSIDGSRFDRLKALEDEDGFIENSGGSGKPFFRTGRSNKWQDTLSHAHVDRIIETNGLMMKRFGYLDQDMEPV